MDNTMNESQTQLIKDGYRDLLGDETVDNYFKKVIQIVKTSQKSSNELQGWQHFSDYKGVRMTMNKIQQRLHSLISKVFAHQEINLSINGLNLEKKFEMLREGNDAMLERVNNDLDEACGLRKSADVEIVDNSIRTIHAPITQGSGREMVLIASKNVQKPQLFFPTKVNNSAKEPFLPKITEKPNSIKPLAIMLCITDNGTEYYSHPYDYELQHWNPSEKFLIHIATTSPLPLEETELIIIKTSDQLIALVEELKKCKEIAIDLEHHSFRSYLGITCLIQISTREKDFIIDPFPLIDQLVILNEVFTNPKITKVLHGADQDILWLQRDFGLYIVNMFDTHQAAVVLDFPHRSLAALLHSYCSIAADKTYQRADWRIRPIPDDFLEYAQKDTHYLLFIYDNLRNELIDKGNDLNNLLHATYSRSMEICCKRFEKPMVGPDSHLEIYRRSKKMFNNRQLYAMQQIYCWRDRIGREQDESVDYVLPKHMMLQIAEVMPKEIQGIVSCCNPIPSLVKTEQLTLHQLIKAARELPLEDVILSTEGPNAVNSTNSGTDQGLGSQMICRHDLSQMEESHSSLSTLLNPQETLVGDLFQENPTLVKTTNKSTLFGLKSHQLVCNRSWELKVSEDFSSPFERYLLYLKIKPSIETEEEESAPPPPSKPPLKENYFMSLTQTKPTQDTISPNADPSDLTRILRLHQHIATVSQEENQTLSSTKSKKTLSQLKKMDYEKSNGKKAKKRKSAEIHEKNKKQKNGIAGKTKEEKHEDEPQQNPEEEAEAIESFDYNKADYSIFGKNKSNWKKNRKIKEKFKGKSSTKNTGSKKSGLKSISWGK